MARRRTLSERFWPKVEKHGPMECWPWLAARYPNGYGMMGSRDGRSTMLAHRVAYELCVGPIPADHDLHHCCGNKRCVNPAHLLSVNSRDHLLFPDSSAGMHARKTHCKNDHEFTAENTYITARGARYCRACGAASHRRKRLERKAALSGAA